MQKLIPFILKIPKPVRFVGIRRRTKDHKDHLFWKKSKKNHRD